MDKRIEKLKDWIRMWELQRNEALEEIHCSVEAGAFKEKTLDSLAHQIVQLLVPQGDDEGIVDIKRLFVAFYTEKWDKKTAEEVAETTTFEFSSTVAKAQRDLTRQERLSFQGRRPGREKILNLLHYANRCAGESEWRACGREEKWVDGYCKDKDCSDCATDAILALIPDEESFREEGRGSERGRIRDTILAEFLDDSGVECVSIPKQSLKGE